VVGGRTLNTPRVTHTAGSLSSLKKEKRKSGAAAYAGSFLGHTDEVFAYRIASLTRLEREISRVGGDGLTSGTAEIPVYVAHGINTYLGCTRTYRQIAYRLSTREAAVKQHVDTIMTKVGVPGCVELLSSAYRDGLAKPPH